MKTGTRIKRELNIQPPLRPGNIKVLPEDWLACATVLLVEQGVAELSVQKIADRLGVSRGSFHYYFGTVEVLYEKLLNAWESSNQLLPHHPEALDQAQAMACLNRLCNPLDCPGQFDPQLELAIREWARRSPEVLARVRSMDSRRLTILNKMFIAVGHPEQQASVLAPIFYELKVGWLATDLAERSTESQLQAQSLLREIIAPPHPVPSTPENAERRQTSAALTV